MWNLARIASSFRDDHLGHSPSNASNSAGVGMRFMLHPTTDIERRPQMRDDETLGISEQDAEVVFRCLTELAARGIVTIRGKGGALEVVSRSMRV